MNCAGNIKVEGFLLVSNRYYYNQTDEAIFTRPFELYLPNVLFQSWQHEVDLIIFGTKLDLRLDACEERETGCWQPTCQDQKMSQ